MWFHDFVYHGRVVDTPSWTSWVCANYLHIGPALSLGVSQTFCHHESCQIADQHFRCRSRTPNPPVLRVAGRCHAKQLVAQRMKCGSDPGELLLEPRSSAPPNLDAVTSVASLTLWKCKDPVAKIVYNFTRHKKRVQYLNTHSCTATFYRQQHQRQCQCEKIRPWIPAFLTHILRFCQEGGVYKRYFWASASSETCAPGGSYFAYSVFLGVMLAWLMQSPETLFFDLQQLY